MTRLRFQGWWVPMAVSALVTGCFGHAEVRSRYAAEPSAPTFAPVAADQVQVFSGLDWETLPAPKLQPGSRPK